MFLNIYTAPTCSDSYNSLCFKIYDKANSKFDLKIEETLHINWRKPNLKSQQNHSALTLSLELLFPFLVSVFFCLLLFFAILFHLLLSISLR